MSWLETLAEIAEPGSAPDGAQAYLRGQVIQQAVSQGASGAAALGYLRRAGLGIRTQQFYEAWRAETERQAGAATANQVDWHQPASDALAAAAPAAWTGQYVHQVTLTSRELAPEGNYLLHTRTMAIKSRNVLTPQDAVSAAMQIATMPVSEGGTDIIPDVSSLLGSSLSGVWYDTQGRSLRAV